MPNLAHLIEAIRRRLSSEDPQLLRLVSARYRRESYDPEHYDRAFDRVLNRIRASEGPRLQAGLRAGLRADP